jgi:hypothetical protein
LPSPALVSHMLTRYTGQSTAARIADLKTRELLVRLPILLTGAGVKPGIVHGETDDFSTNVVSEGVQVHDLPALV